MWVFDGNGFTMTCLAVWIGNVALGWRPFATARRSGAMDAAASKGSSPSVAWNERSNIRDRFHGARDGFRSVHPGRWLCPKHHFVTWQPQEFGQHLIRS